MPVYAVTAVLHNREENRKRFVAELERSRSCCWLFGSTWLVQSTQSLDGLSRRLQQAMDLSEVSGKTELLFIVELTHASNTGWYGRDEGRWLKSKLEQERQESAGGRVTEETHETHR